MWCLQQMEKSMSRRSSLLEKFEMNFMYTEVLLLFNVSVAKYVALCIIFYLQALRQSAYRDYGTNINNGEAWLIVVALWDRKIRCFSLKQ
jgi:hypothetical protein